MVTSLHTSICHFLNLHSLLLLVKSPGFLRLLIVNSASRKIIPTGIKMTVYNTPFQKLNMAIISYSSLNKVQKVFFQST